MVLTWICFTGMFIRFENITFSTRADKGSHGVTTMLRTWMITFTFIYICTQSRILGMDLESWITLTFIANFLFHTNMSTNTGLVTFIDICKSQSKNICLVVETLKIKTLTWKYLLHPVSSLKSPQSSSPSHNKVSLTQISLAHLYVPSLHRLELPIKFKFFYQCCAIHMIL